MARSLLVAPTAAGVGLTRTCRGVVRALDRGVHVAFVKPVADRAADSSPDRSTTPVAAIISLHPPVPMAAAELEQARAGPAWCWRRLPGSWESVYDLVRSGGGGGHPPGPGPAVCRRVQPGAGPVGDADVLLVGRWPADTAAGRDRAGGRTGRGPGAGTTAAGRVAETLAIATGG